METIDKATSFFQYGILPELVVKWYSREMSPALKGYLTLEKASQSDIDDKWCYCGKSEYGEIIRSNNCKINKFHIEHLKTPKVPKGTWYCHNFNKKIQVIPLLSSSCHSFFHFHFLKTNF